MTDQSPAALSAIAIVRRLCTEWPTLSRADYHDLLTPDCLYINIPMAKRACVGPDQAHDLIAAFISGWKMDLRILHIQGDGKTVLTERFERFESQITIGKIVELHVMGAFEIKDGKIAHWRDYFDSKESQALSAGA
jgi:limonene-1,2-epoxide hydrolase